MSHLLFTPDDFIQELQALTDLSRSFLNRELSFDLSALTDGLKLLKGNPLTSQPFEIPFDRPIVTRASTGEFEPKRKTSSRQVAGEITGIWEIGHFQRPYAKENRKGRKRRQVYFFGFTGKASTVLKVRDLSSNAIIASWKMELGSVASPGCFFHTFASEDETFPVPRHPSVFATPMAAMAFLLGELFQDDWKRAVSGGSGAATIWRSIQLRRLKAILGWQLQCVDESDSSPWCDLKCAKPNEFLFI